MDISTPRGQITQNDKFSLCRQIGYIDIRTQRSQIGQNDKRTLCRQFGYYVISTLRGEIGRMINLLHVVNWAILL